MTRNYYKEICELMIKKNGSYELKEMLTWNAIRTITNCDISLLCLENCTFHPDYPEDGVTYYSEEDIRRLMKNYGLEEYVKKVLYELENLEICD